jgi:hypothetical protein
MHRRLEMSTLAEVWGKDLLDELERDISTVRVGDMVLVVSSQSTVSRRFGGFINGIPYYVAKDSNKLIPESSRESLRKIPPFEWNTNDVPIPCIVSRVAVMSKSGFICVLRRENVVDKGEIFSWMPLD